MSVKAGQAQGLYVTDGTGLGLVTEVADAGPTDATAKLVPPSVATARRAARSMATVRNTGGSLLAADLRW